MATEHARTAEPDRPVETGRRRDVPLVSIVVPAFNEASILEDNLDQLSRYLDTLDGKYRWEMILVNDGSTDATGELAEDFARRRGNVRVLHHFTNFGIGQAFQYAFKHCAGDYIVTLDLDLSYAPEHVERLLDKLTGTKAKVVLASPYMKGGRISNVPWLRRKLSIWANRFLSIAARGRLSTLTSMVRAYDARFLRSLDLRSQGMDVMPEIIHKALILGARIEEVPAHLDWRSMKEEKPKRQSSMRIVRHTLATLLSGFLFRPFMFFIAPGFLLLAFSVWIGGWGLVHFYDYFVELQGYETVLTRASAALEMAFDRHTHTYVIGLLSAMLSIQLISLGILALQSMNYFEELFHLGTTVYRSAVRQADSNCRESQSDPGVR